MLGQSSTLALLSVTARSPERSAAATWSRMRASSGEMTSVGPLPCARRRPEAIQYTADLPQPVRWITTTLRRSATNASMAAHWSSRSTAAGPARRVRWSCAVARRPVVAVMKPIVTHAADTNVAAVADCGR